jgi:hypothetical protein
LAIITGLLLIAIFIFSAMSISLFDLIGMKISKFYMENIAILCIAVSPVVAALLIDLYPEITSRIAPVIARIFAPLVLVSAVIYLISIAISGISILEKREFLLIFNLLLLSVMAIIVFSVSEPVSFDNCNTPDRYFCPVRDHYPFDLRHYTKQDSGTGLQYADPGKSHSDFTGTFPGRI